MENEEIQLIYTQYNVKLQELINYTRTLLYRISKTNMSHRHKTHYNRYVINKYHENKLNLDFPAFLFFLTYSTPFCLNPILAIAPLIYKSLILFLSKFIIIFLDISLKSPAFIGIEFLLILNKI